MTTETTIRFDENDEFKPDFKKTGKEILIDLINWSNHNTMTTLLSPETTFFTKPKKLSIEEDMNTEIRLAKVEGFRIPQGTESIFYNRLDINQLALLMPWDFVIYIDEKKVYNTTWDLIEDLFNVFPVKLTEEDIVKEEVNFTLADKSFYNDDVIDGYREGLTKNKVEIKISDESVGYYGSLHVRIFPKPINIDAVIKVRKFKGFTHIPKWGLS